MPKKKNPPQWSQVKALFHLRLRDAAAQLDVSDYYIKSLCRKNGVSRWPGQKMRFYMDKQRKLEMEAAAGQSAPPGEPGHRPPALIAQELSKVTKMIDDILQNPNPPAAPQEHGGVGHSGMPSVTAAHMPS